MKHLRIMFMGTSVFAVPSLEALIASHHEVIGVVSQPDRPRGRGKHLQPTPVKEVAVRHGLEVLQFARIKDLEARQEISRLNPDLIVVVSYGQIIPMEILDIPKMGCVNVHASLLPRYRGAAPIQRAIMDGETVTGITTMLMDRGLDTGDILMQAETPIVEDIDHGELEQCLAELGARLLISTIDGLINGRIEPRKQNAAFACYAAMIKRDEEEINWGYPAFNIHNHIRGLSPVPGAYTIFRDERLKIFRSRVLDKQGRGEAGMIVDLTADGFVVQTGEGTLEILELQKQGRKRMGAREFMKGFPLNERSKLGKQEE